MVSDWMVCRVSLGASEAKQRTHGFGLQCAQPTGQAHTVPGVPEPWMGTYGEKLPVIPQDVKNIRCVAGSLTNAQQTRYGSSGTTFVMIQLRHSSDSCLPWFLPNLTFALIQPVHETHMCIHQITTVHAGVVLNGNECKASQKKKQRSLQD